MARLRTVPLGPGGEGGTRSPWVPTSFLPPLLWYGDEYLNVLIFKMQNFCED